MPHLAQLGCVNFILSEYGLVSTTLNSENFLKTNLKLGLFLL